MSFLNKAKKKAEEEAKKAAEAARKAGEKGAEGAKKAGEKVKEAGEKGVEETKKAAQKAKEKSTNMPASDLSHPTNPPFLSSFASRYLEHSEHTSCTCTNVRIEKKVENGSS